MGLSTDEREAMLEAFREVHANALRTFVEHLLRVFRGEVDVLSGKCDRLRERLEALEKNAVENAVTEVR